MIIADTGFFFALSNRHDAYHQQAKRVLATVNEPLLTPYPVLTETCYLLSNYGDSAKQCNFLKDIRRGAAEIYHLQPHNLDRMIELMERYADLPMDFTDASLVALAEHLGHGRILTVDRRDFSTYRWNNQNPFVNLLLP
jgi:uncharacterized protein